MALTQTQLLAAVAERAEFTKADTKRVLDALEVVHASQRSACKRTR